MGILFLGSDLEYYRGRFGDAGIPGLLVTNSAEGMELENLSSVSTDDEGAAQTAIEYLFTLGHREIGVLGGKLENSYAARSRYMGCRRAFELRGRNFDRSRQYEGARFSMEDGYHGMLRILNKMPEVTAVFAMSDVMAIGAIRAIKDRGLRVPEDISVIGFDGIVLSQYMCPRLTTIKQDSEIIARRSLNTALERWGQRQESLLISSAMQDSSIGSFCQSVRPVTVIRRISPFLHLQAILISLIWICWRLKGFWIKKNMYLSIGVMMHHELITEDFMNNVIRF